MKKNNLYIFISLIILIVIAIILFFSNYGIENGKIQLKSSTLSVKRDFAVEDTASVNKIYLVDKNNKELLLDKKSQNNWIVNDKYNARDDFVNVLLETIHRIKVANPVPESKKDYVLRDLSSNGIKCEIYKNDELFKTYYVGGVTKDNLGTYMLLEGSSEPFEVNLPGFNGYLTTRYTTDIGEWRSKTAFKYESVDNVKKVKVRYPENKNESFLASRVGDNSYKLSDISGDNYIHNFDTVTVKQLMSRFKKIGLEFYLEEKRQNKIVDSLKKETPFVEFFVTNKKNKTEKLSCYKRPNVKRQVDEEGHPFDFDIDRLYGIKNGEAFVMQYYTIDPLRIKLSELIKKNR